tara:strand:+ start:807 stop:1751 length:945 start_codon:yes stop_codon:yes gene_type:complete
MSISQTKKLKITAVNIRSVLTENNKELGKLNKQKSVLIRRQRLKAERMAAEKKIEKQGKEGKGPIKSILSNVTSGVMSLWSRLLNFVGYLIMPWIIEKLPPVLKFLKSAFNFVAPLIKVAWKVISTIAKALWTFGSWVSKLFNRKEAETHVKSLEESSDIVTQQLNSIDIPTLNNNSQKSTEKENITKSTTNTEVSKLNSEQIKEKSQTNKENLSVDKEIKADIESEKKQNPIQKLLSFNPTKIMKGEDQQSKSMDLRMPKNTKDLKGNLKNKNIKTIIVPIEVEKIVERTSSMVNNSIQTPAPLPSSTNRRLN